MKRFVVLVVAMLALASASSQAKSTAITIGTFSKALGNSPYYVARHFKWFEDDPSMRGVTITYKEYADRSTISDAFSRGELQALFSAEVPSILCRAQGNDIRICAVSATVGQDILVRNELPVKSVRELRGRTLAVLKGTSSQYCLLKILKDNGMRESDVQLKFMAPPVARTDFEQDRLDAWAVWAPWVEQQQVSGKGRLVPGGKAFIDSVMSVSAPFLNAEPAQSRAIVSAIRRAKAWIVGHPQEAQKIAAEELGLDPKVVAVAWPKHNWGVQLDRKSVTDFQKKADFLADTGETRNSVHVDVRRDLADLRFATSSFK